MRALTLTQPWATLVALGAKRIETRSWATPYRGWLAIHAAKGLAGAGGSAGLRELNLTEPFHQPLADAGYGPWGKALPLGAIVAIALLDHCGEIYRAGVRGQPRVWLSGGPTEVTEPELSFGDYTPGRYGWVFSNVYRLPEPVPCRGALGLWTVPSEVETVVRAALGTHEAYVI
jgi:hypothetical protein